MSISGAWWTLSHEIDRAAGGLILGRQIEPAVRPAQIDTGRDAVIEIHGVAVRAAVGAARLFGGLGLGPLIRGLGTRLVSGTCRRLSGGCCRFSLFFTGRGRNDLRLRLRG